jgi:hypothetical protein
LQSTFKPKITFTNFSHMPIPMKAVIRANCWMDNAEVNADNFVIRDKFYIRKLNHNMKIKFIIPIYKVCCCRLSINRIQSIFRDGEWYLQSATSCRYTNKFFAPIYSKSMSIISRRATLRLRTGYLVSLLNPSLCGLQRFRGFLSSLYMQVGNKKRGGFLAFTISNVMQVIRIGIISLPPHLADMVERFSKLLHCFIQSICLLRRRSQYYTDCSIHEYIIPYTEVNL